MKRKQKRAPKANPKVAIKPAKAKFGAKAAFVRAHADLAAKDVVDLAAKAGLAMTVNHVYNVRSTSGISRRVTGGRASTPRAGAALQSSTTAAKAGISGAESQFRRLVLQIGVARARVLLRDVESKLAALLDGR